MISYHAKVNPSAVNQNLLSFIFIKANEIIGDEETGKLLAQIPEVLEVHDIAGDDGYIIKVRTSDTIALMNLMKDLYHLFPELFQHELSLYYKRLKKTINLL